MNLAYLDAFLAISEGITFKIFVWFQMNAPGALRS